MRCNIGSSSKREVRMPGSTIFDLLPLTYFTPVIASNRTGTRTKFVLQ